MVGIRTVTVYEGRLEDALPVITMPVILVALFSVHYLIREEILARHHVDMIGCTLIYPPDCSVLVQDP